MNAEVIDSNRFGPYGEPLDPVVKNARLKDKYYKNNTIKSMVESVDSNIYINYQYDPAGNIIEKVEIKDGVEERYT